MADLNKQQRADAETYAHRAIVIWLPLLYLLISSLFFLRTYDSAQVKISMMQMGGVGLLTLWLVRLIVAGKHALNRDDLVCLAPFLAYLFWGVFSYVKSPYHMASTDFFLRHLFYMIVALITIYEFDEAAIARLFKILIWTAWIAIGYGALQFVDNSAFPPGPGKGIDPFVWRGAFSDRVFSTYGNPNFYGDFLVIMFPILVTQWFKTKRWSLIALIGLLLLSLVKTGTKGAWLGFALVCFLFGVIALVFFSEQSKPYRKQLLAVVGTLVLGFVGYTAKDLSGRVVSINFRLFTWESTFEMIRTQPWTGTGIGSFPPVYPAFRRPAIFHIEGKHNTETDHAENEYLEQFFDNGILGFGIFIWLVLSTLVVGFRSLGQLTTTAMIKDGRPPPRAYDLIGVLVSFMGMLGHNSFDVSLLVGRLSGPAVGPDRQRRARPRALRAPCAPRRRPGRAGGQAVVAHRVRDADLAAAHRGGRRRSLPRLLQGLGVPAPDSVRRHVRGVRRPAGAALARARRRRAAAVVARVERVRRVHALARLGHDPPLPALGESGRAARRARDALAALSVLGLLQGGYSSQRRHLFFKRAPVGAGRRELSHRQPA